LVTVKLSFLFNLENPVIHRYLYNRLYSYVFISGHYVGIWYHKWEVVWEY